MQALVMFLPRSSLCHVAKSHIYHFIGDAGKGGGLDDFRRSVNKAYPTVEQGGRRHPHATCNTATLDRHKLCRRDSPAH